MSDLSQSILQLNNAPQQEEKEGILARVGFKIAVSKCSVNLLQKSS